LIKQTDTSRANLSSIADNGVPDKGPNLSPMQDGDTLLREFYEQLPLGVTVEDYSAVKSLVDDIFSQGIEDLEQHLIDNPDVLFKMVWEIQGTDANNSLLKLFKVNSLQEYLDLDDDHDHWKHTGWAEFYLHEIVSFSKGQTHFGDYLDSAADGTPIECRCVAWIPSGYENNWSHVITTHEDITKRKQAEMEILKQRDELKALNAQKDEFFAIIAHDLKSPFNALKGFSYLLSEQVEDMSTKEIKQYAALVNRSAEEAHQLVEDLLDWALVQFDRINFNPVKCDLNKIVDTNLTRYQPVADIKKIKIKIDTAKNLKVHGDANMIDTILRNFISNAIKFSDQSGTVTISTRKNDNMANIRIKDDGIGISSSNLARLFQLDKKVQMQGTEGETGTGFGLHLCKKMAELNGGEIFAESIIGEGSVFSFTLPLQGS
jgi:nitrogen-specific signal transduction histidine kinase